jgi:hypothetical protein
VALCWLLIQSGLTLRRRRGLCALPADRVYQFRLSVTTHSGKHGILSVIASEG